ncbi:hypothetical protein [Marinobacter salsuginis]|uniref:hypothetical protein n=1 Tax=Marinobacter salsuginis TaxID=418719 RepID=UPI001AE010FC|nr:hypothetical protein [Marinobacter salsuginis]QTN41452.1 hypothetical protein HZ997_17715 [Marinobacter salsuginis]
MTEDDYKKRLVNLLQDDFELFPEYGGAWPTGEVVYLDFFCKPKQHVIDQGFSIDCFAVEVKSPDVGREPIKKLLDCVLQSYSYTLCDFKGLRPKFTLIYPEPRMFFCAQKPEKYTGQHNPMNEPEIDIVKRLMQRANVGELVEDKNFGYEFRFSRNRMYDPVRGPSKVANLGSVRRIGSRKVKV